MQNKILKPNYEFVQDIFAGRKDRVGASDIPALIPNPARPGESFAGYGRTAITVYEEKIGVAEKEPTSFYAQMGHFLEPIILREFISDFYNKSVADAFYESYIFCEIGKEKACHFSSDYYNNKHLTSIHDEHYIWFAIPFKHHTEAVVDYGIAHADCLYVPGLYDPVHIRTNAPIDIDTNVKMKKVHNIKFDIQKPAIIEAKSAQLFSARRGEDMLTGYDFKQSGWQGIPMRVYLQVLFQMTLYNIDLAYVALISNTSQKGYWQIKPNKKWQSKLQQLAWDMRQAIKNRQPPREMAISAADISKLYTDIKDDYTVISGEELDRAVGLVRDYRDAQTQHKTWKRREEEYRDAAAVILKDSPEIRGIIDGKLQTIMKWKNTGGAEAIMSLGDIKELDSKYYKYMIRNNLIKKTKEGRKPDIKLKIKEEK